MRQTIFPLNEVLKVYKKLESLNIKIWLDGGWGVDALLSQQSRDHKDLDIVVQQKDLKKLHHYFKEFSYKQIARNGSSAWNYVVRNVDGLEIDVHVIEFDELGNGIYGPKENGVYYPKESLEGKGLIDRMEVNCLSADYQLISHTGYKIKEKDFVDVEALCSKFKLKPPVIYPLLKWASDELNLVIDSLDYKIIVETPWSLVIKILQDKDNHYLKKTPHGLFIESQVTKLIKKIDGRALVPEIVSEHQQLDAFLMKSCGNESLRKRFDGKIDLGLWFEGIKSYVMIQKLTKGNLDNFLSQGVPDWRAHKLISHFKSMLSDEIFMKQEGFSSKDCMRLEATLPKLEETCNKILKFGVTDALVNCDFNENNMVYNDDSGEVSIIDLGECVIAHPLLSVSAHLFASARRYKLSKKSPLMIEMRDKWLSLYNSNIELYQLISSMSPIFAALGIKRLQDVTQNNSKQHQNWFIKDILSDFIQE